MNLVLLGAPGSGKGTQARHLQERFGIVHVASGDLFREHHARGTDLGRGAEVYISQGLLVPDDLTIAMLRERVAEPDTSHGVLFDGFPRTIAQAEALDQMLREIGRTIDDVLYLAVDDDVLVERLSGRLICRECQAPFHRQANPFRGCPFGRCHGEHLYQRPDDAPETVRVRLATFNQRTAPVTEYYRARGLLRVVNGSGSVDDVARRLAEAVQASTA